MVRIRSITARSARALAVSRLRGNRDLHFTPENPHVMVSNRRLVARTRMSWARRRRGAQLGRVALLLKV